VRFEDQLNESLGPGAYLSREDLAITGLTVGRHTITIVTDAQETVVESNETDNEVSKTIFISAPPLPNLALHQPAGWPDTIVLSNQPGTLTDDNPLFDTIYVDWSVLNDSASPVAAPFWTWVYVDDLVCFEDLIGVTLPPDAYLSREDLVLSGLTPGQHTIRIVTDAAGAIAESNEADNEYVREFFVEQPTGKIRVVKDALPDDPQDFTFTGSFGMFLLDDDSDPTLPNRRTFENLSPGVYTVTEAALAGWDFSSIVVSDPDGGSSVDLANRTAVIELDPGESITVLFTNAQQLDFGDAPEPAYPTLLASNGARHGSTGLKLGAGCDAEGDGQPNADASGDDLDGNDDEDGLQWLTPLIPAKTARVSVTASEPGLLNAWIDWNADGDWMDAADQVFTDQTLTAGDNVLSIAVPQDATVTTPGNPTFARFRFSSVGGLSYTGWAPDGEVEDYEVAIESAFVDDLVGRNQYGYLWVAKSNGSNAFSSSIWGRWSTARTWTDVLGSDFGD